MSRILPRGRDVLKKTGVERYLSQSVQGKHKDLP